MTATVNIDVSDTGGDAFHCIAGVGDGGGKLLGAFAGIHAHPPVLQFDLHAGAGVMRVNRIGDGRYAVLAAHAFHFEFGLPLYEKLK
jgi:hypothetical protein